MSFVVPYSTFPATFLFDLGAATAGNTAPRRAPPPARRPAPWAEFLRHFRAHGGRPTLLDLFPSSLAAVLNLAGGNAAASRSRARALFWGERRSRERSDRYARPVGPVLTGLTGVVDRSNRFTIQSCVLKLPKFVEKS